MKAYYTAIYNKGDCKVAKNVTIRSSIDCKRYYKGHSKGFYRSTVLRCRVQGFRALPRDLRFRIQGLGLGSAPLQC